MGVNIIHHRVYRSAEPLRLHLRLALASYWRDIGVCWLTTGHELGSLAHIPYLSLGNKITLNIMLSADPAQRHRGGGDQGGDAGHRRRALRGVLPDRSRAPRHPLRCLLAGGE
jgi:hypothetical protein